MRVLVDLFIIIIEMKILVKFSEDIGIEPLEKEVNANETVENLEVKHPNMCRF